MITEAIRAEFRWWAKHPWFVFWGTILIFFVYLFASHALYRPPGFVSITVLLLSPIVLIFSFCRGVFVTWQRSGIGALMPGAALLLVFGFLAAMAFPQFAQFAAYRRRTYDADVKVNLKNAAKAQAAYYKDKSTFAANIDSLPGFNQSDNVNITVEATATTFIITGTMKEGCSPNTGTWTYNSTDGSFSGTPCQ